MAYCKKCGAELEEGGAFCGDCGAAVEEASVSDGSKRIQKFVGDGVQYKCPSCGEVVSRTARKCPACGYKIEFKAETDIVKNLVSLIGDNPYFSRSVASVVNSYDFPLNAQEMFELALFARGKFDAPMARCSSMFNEEWDSCEFTAWYGLIDRIYEKSLFLEADQELVNKIARIKDDAEKKYNEKMKLGEKLSKKAKRNIKIIIIVIVAFALFPMLFAIFGIE